VTGGGDELGVAERVELGERALELADDGAGGDDGRGSFDGNAEELKDVGGPVAGFEVDEASVSGVGVLGHAAAPSQWRTNSGMVSQGCGDRFRQRVGQKLVDGVDAVGQDAGALVEVEGATMRSAASLVATVRSSR